MELRHIGYEKRGHTAIVTIDRPASLNALNVEAHQELSWVWDDFAADEQLWTAILTGAGEKAFCVGADVKEIAAKPEMTFWDMNGGAHGFGGLVNRFDLRKPVIGAVNGLAMGGGFALVLACDLVVAARSARFSLPEPRIGAPSGFGGLERLLRQIPEKWAMEIILTAEPFDAEQALRFGLVNRVEDPRDVLPVALALAETIHKSSPLAVQANLEAARRARDVPLEASTAWAGPAVRRLWASSHNAEGRDAFLEKRMPDWDKPAGKE